MVRAHRLLALGALTALIAASAPTASAQPNDPYDPGREPAAPADPGPQLPQPPPYPPAQRPPPPHHYQAPRGPAQPQPPDHLFRPRSKWMLGFTFGPHDIQLDDDAAAPGLADNSGGGFTLHFGGMVSPRMALVAELGAMVEELNDFEQRTLAQVTVGLVAQYWARPRVWVRAGVVSSTLTARAEGSDDEQELGKGPGVTFGIGYEVVHRKRFSVDIQLRGTMASYRDNSLLKGSATGGAALGFNWY